MIIGNLGSDVEMGYTPQGTAVADFRVAVNDRYKDKETTEWFNVVVWDKQAETCNQYLEKGRAVYVEGRLQTRSWDGTDGIKHYKTEVIASRVQFLDKKEKTEYNDSEEEEEFQL